MDTNIYLVGDSVLDNFRWMANPQQNLTQQLINITDRSVTIYNFAVDETRIKDILIGKRPRSIYQNIRAQYNLEKYPIAENGHVYPLNLLKQYKNSLKRNIVVISMGGNDLRKYLCFLKDGWKTVFNKLINENFIRNYIDVIKHIHEITPEIILIVVYKPYKDFCSQYREELDKLLESTRKIILIIAKQFKLPVIDLSKTFNPNDPTHYGMGNGHDPIEPSLIGSQFIADLIKKVISDFKFGVDESKVYSHSQNIIIMDNFIES